MPLIPVANGGKVSAPLTAPVKSGYAFLRWSASVGGPAYNFNTPITADTTLYAVWSPQGNISYTVLYWQENANDTGYTYVESASRTGQAGNKANYSPKNYSNFTFSRADDVTIAGDGSTIVNVYYNRTTYTLTFKVWKGGGFSGNWFTIKTVTAKHGADIRQIWPINGTDGINYESYAWYDTGNTYDYPLVTLESHWSWRRYVFKNISY